MTMNSRTRVLEVKGAQKRDIPRASKECCMSRKKSLNRDIQRALKECYMDTMRDNHRASKEC
jgi:hypothetical protein